MQNSPFLSAPQERQSSCSQNSHPAIDRMGLFLSCCPTPIITLTYSKLVVSDKTCLALEF